MSRVLVLDSDFERAKVLYQALTAAGHEVIAERAEALSLVDVVRRLLPDVIIIDTESPDRDTLEHICVVTRDHPRPIVMFSGDGNGERIREAVKAGVTAYVVNGFAPERIQPILDVAVARFGEMQALRADLAQARAKLEDRKLIDRAKGILMQSKGMSEEEAYGWLRRLAMESSRPMGEVAGQLIAMRELFG